MKPILTFLLPIILFLTSCQKNEYVVPNRTIVVDLAPTSWRSSDGGKSFSAIINMPEITNDFNERGGVLVYLSFGSRTYEQLPQVYDGISYTFTTSPGVIKVELESSDGATSVISPPGQTVTAKIVLVESQF